MSKNYIEMNAGKREIDVDEVLKLFLNYSKSKNLSKRTIRFYENNFNKFIRFLEDNDIEIINQVNSQVVIGFILFLQDKPKNKYK